MKNDFIVKMAQVESIEDESDGLRIKARIEQDGKLSTAELPYSYPLLPKTFRIVPKVGECVLVFLAQLGNSESNRYYIGPIISQDQKLEYDSYDYGRGRAISLLKTGELEPFIKLSKYEDTRGSFPNLNDVSVVGRKSEDIILKDDEIDIRCGIRSKPENSKDYNYVGNIIFNKVNPAYIQLKYKRGIGRSKKQEADSIINLVADKVNIISHKDVNSFNLTDRDELIKTNDMDNIMSKLHQLPYGDKLVELLELIINVILTHVHPYPGMPPCGGTFGYNELQTYMLNDILSENVRIS